MTVPDFNIKITDAAEDSKRNMPSSCPVHLPMAILFVFLKITRVGDLTLMMLPISTLWKVEALIMLSVTQPRFWPFTSIQKVSLSDFSSIAGETSLPEF